MLFMKRMGSVQDVVGCYHTDERFNFVSGSANVGVLRDNSGGVEEAPLIETAAARSAGYRRFGTIGHNEIGTSDPYAGVMIDQTVMAQLWTKLRSAVQEFRISRMQRQSDSRFRVVEHRKCSSSRRAKRSSSVARSRLSTRYNELKRVLHRKASLITAAAANFGGGTSSSKADWGFTSAEEEENEEEVEQDESVALIMAHWKERENGKLLPKAEEVEIATIALSNRWDDLGSPDWERTILASSVSTRPAFQSAESSSGTYSNPYRRENRDWRLSHKSPQLLQPVRGKLTTLSSLLKTMSDRYARRTGKLTPMHEKASKKPLLTQSVSAPWMQKPDHTFSSMSKSVNSAVMRYDNPFQEFLNRAYAEKHSKLAREGRFRIDSNHRSELLINT